MSDNATEKAEIETLLTEYSVLKSEQIASEEAQMTIATAAFSFITAIVGLNFFFGERISTPESFTAGQYMILGFCPLIIMFFGCLWMRHLYSQTRFGAYMYHLEEDINSFYPDSRQWMYFEHWIRIQEEPQVILGKEGSKKKRSLWNKIRMFWGRTSHYNGYITLGTWLVAPALLYFFAGGLFPEWNILNFLLNNLMLSVPLACIFIVYYVIQFGYLHSILKLTSKNEFERARTSPRKRKNK